MLWLAERLLGAGGLAGAALVDAAGGREGAAERFHQRLGLVVVVDTGEHARVEIEATFVGQRLEEVLDEVAGYLADHRAGPGDVERGIAPTREVDGDLGQDFVQRD